MHFYLTIGSIFQITAAVALTIALALSPAMLPGVAMAKKADGGETHNVFYGIVEVCPEGRLQGVWVIGGRILTTDERTEFNQSEGDLLVGGCAKVEVRNGRVHEIDSDPPGDCP